MKKMIMWAIAALFATNAALAADPIKIPLWPDGAPTKNGLEGQQEEWKGGKIYNTSEAELWIYPAKKPNGMAILDVPGGGYHFVSSDNEGTMLVDFMNTQGITWAILKYRIPNGHSTVPLEDGQRAMQILREQASKYKFSPNRVGVMGWSAGGHFAATLSNLYEKPEYRPDFSILIYPVISMTPITHKGSHDNLIGTNPAKGQEEKYSLENRVTANTPPTFMALACDDKTVNPMNSMLYAEALLKNKVPVSLHLYPTGGHGFGFKDTCPYKRQWTEELERWLRLF